METFRAEILPNSLSPFCPPLPPRLSTGRNAVARTGEQTDSRRWPKLMHNGWKNGLWRKKSRRGGGKFVENRWGQSGNRVGNPSRPARPVALRLSPPFSPGFPRPCPPLRARLPPPAAPEGFAVAPERPAVAVRSRRPAPAADQVEFHEKRQTPLISVRLLLGCYKSYSRFVCAIIIYPGIFE